MDCSPIVLAHEEPFAIGAAEVRPATRELLFNGQTAECLTQLDRAIRIDPLEVYPHMWRATCLWDLGRLGEAEEELDQSYNLWPRHYAIWFPRCYFLAFTGRPHEAIAMVADTASRPVGVPEWNYQLLNLQCRALATKDPADLDKAMTAWMEAARRGAGFAENGFIFAAAIGRFDEAFEIANAYYFDRGFRLSENRYASEQGIFTAKTLRHTYILFRLSVARLRRDPRFKQLTREIGLDDYWARSRSRPTA